MKTLAGKTALITGGTTGIGLETARTFIEAGAQVVVTGQNAARVAAAQATLGSAARVVQVDVRNWAGMQALSRQIGEQYGHLDVVFANAGVALVAPLAEVDETHIETLLDTNIKGVIYTVNSMLPILANPASIILTASTVAEQGLPGMSVYSATKAAVRSLARGFSAELIGQGVRVNTISPGPIETPIYGKLGLDQQQLEGMSAQILAKVPSGRFGQPSDIAQAALYLASPASQYMVGEDLLIDGGMARL
jgi:NAD(P)-dependent dehydrogenase (short-subunit alcohol dehydrogenase family)